MAEQVQEHILSNVGPEQISIAYERIGNLEDPAVILIQGVGVQLVGWLAGFCEPLIKQGLQIIRFDNRDAGKSTHFDKAPDTVGLPDALGIEKAHLVGASMGGAIAQTIAIEYPTRVHSLTSMMSTTGDMSVGQPPQ